MIQKNKERKEGKKKEILDRREKKERQRGRREEGGEIKQIGKEKELK